MGNCQNNEILQGSHLPILGRLGPVTDLKMINLVWQKDYLGLFDYDSKDVVRKIYTIKLNSLIICKKDHKIIKQIVPAEYTQEILRTASFQVRRKTNYYQVLPIYIDSEQETVQKLLWLIIKTVPNHRYAIREKDIIKFGKQKIRVREIIPHDSTASDGNDFASIKAQKKIYEDLTFKSNAREVNLTSKEDMAAEIQSVVTESEPTCRICLEAGQLTNPLICPCKCIGSVRYIHLRCLRMWLGKRLNVSKGKFCISIKWIPLTCQMCKTNYKYRIYLDNKKYYTVEIPKPAKPYIVLEVMRKNVQFSKVFHFISLSETSKVSIGRKKDIDIKISDDVSVSRHHANLIYDFENRGFLLEDNKSKFGTLVLVKKNLLVNPFHRGISFQMGAEVFMFETQRGEGSIPDYYDEQNYLNVVDKEEKNIVEEEDSEDDNEEFEEEEEEQEPDGNILTNVNIVGNQSLSNNSIHQNNSALVINQNPPIINPAINPANASNPALYQVVEIEEVLDA